MSLKDYIPYYKRNLKVAAPVMLTQLGAGLAGLIDTIMVGHYSTTALAAVSFANSIFITFMVFSMGALMGLTPLVGYAYVQNNHERVASLWRSGVVFSLILSLVMMSILGLILLFLPYMGQDEEVVRACVPYYIIAMVSTVPFLLYHAEKQFLEGLGNTTVAMVVMIILNVLNIPLNWLLIYGHAGFPAMGATGAGVATLIIRVLQPLIMGVVIYCTPAWKPYLVGTLQSGIKNLKQLAHIGLPIGLQQMLEIFAFTFSVTMVGWISKEAVAAHQIVNNISTFTFLVSTGIGAAATIRVSHQYGQNRIHDMHMAARGAVHLALLWSIVAAGVIISCSHLIPRIFTEDAEVLAIASPLLILCGLYQISDAIQCVGGAMLRGISDVRIPMRMAFVVYIVIALPLGYLLMFPLGLGVSGIWIAFIVGLTLAAVFLQWRWHKIAPRTEGEKND